MDDLEAFRSALERKVRAESNHGWDRARKQWGKPLPERVDSGRAIAGLMVSSRETVGKNQLVHFQPSVTDMSLFREGDLVRLSRNDPDGPGFIEAMFLGLTEKGLSISVPKQAVVQPDEGWTLDESMFDLMDIYLKALAELAATAHGSQMRVEAAVMPMLRAQRWFFFGDRQQLPPVVLRPIEDASEDSVFACLSLHVREHTLLNTTYRLNEPLTRWPSENFYQGRLVAATANAAHRFRLKSVPNRIDMLGPEPSMVRVELDHEGNRVSSTEEADETAALIEGMLESGLPPGEIGVVVPFRAQAARVRNLLYFKRFAKWPDIRQLTVDTVERFQGQEREAMIVSFVVSDEDFMNRLGGFITYPQRLNVAVTRARTKVILIHSRRFHRWLRENAAHDERAAVALSLLEAADS